MQDQTGKPAKWRWPSISRALQLLAVSLLLLITGASVDQLLHERRFIITDSERQMSRLDMVFAEQTGRAIETVDLVIRGAIETWLASPDLSARDPVFAATLARRMRGVRQMTALAITDAAGNVLHASGPDIAGRLPEAGLALLARAKAETGTRPGFSVPFRGSSGQWTVLVACPIRDPASGITGFGVATLNLGYFEDFYKAVDLTENGSIILHLRDGTVLARYPHVDAAIGTSFGHLPPFRDVLAHGMAGTLLMESPIDGSIRVTAIRALKAFPLAVMVSVEQGSLLAEWRRQAWMLGSSVILASLLIGGLLLMLARRSREAERLLVSTQVARAGAEAATSRLQGEIVERERAETALRHAQRIEAIGQLTGGVAHDFNNLLTVVLGNVDLLLRLRTDGAADNLTYTRLLAVKAAAERGATLTNHLLAFARRQPLLVRPTNLNAVILGMGDLLHSATSRGVSLKTRLSATPWSAMVDATQIELLILNLVVNARDAMPDGGEIIVETANRALTPGGRAEIPRAGDYVSIIVRDSGTGMTEEVAARAFEPFFTTKPLGGGSGLGLSQVFGTASQLGGAVEIDSVVGRGTSVAVYLPRALVPAAADPSPSRDPSPLRRPPAGTAVLLVDDDAAVRVAIAASLRAAGFAVREAEDAATALAALDQNPGIDVLLTDLAVPGTDGLQLIDAAHAMRPELPVVLISGHGDAVTESWQDRARQDRPWQDQTRHGQTRHGQARFVRKPFRTEELVDQLTAAMEDAHAVRSPA
jgi:signal transduction histidine kinase/CheY-like chemotaxis protein